MQIQYRPMRTLLVLASLCLGSFHATRAAGADGMRLYAPCVTCHQPNAWGSPDGLIPNLAGQQERYLERQLSEFRSGARVDPAMQMAAVKAATGYRESPDNTTHT